MNFPEQWYRDDYDQNVFLQHKEHLKVWKEVNNDESKFLEHFNYPSDTIIITIKNTDWLPEGKIEVYNDSNGYVFILVDIDIEGDE